MNELIKKIEKIIKLFEDARTTVEIYFESKNDDIKIRLKKNSSGFVQPSPQPFPKHSENIPPPVNPPPQVQQTSKLVGTFRKMLVEVNDFVKKNQPIAQIEVLKVINEVPAEAEGVVLEFLVENDELVEYDQPLLTIQPKP